MLLLFFFFCCAQTDKDLVNSGKMSRFVKCRLPVYIICMRIQQVDTEFFFFRGNYVNKYTNYIWFFSLLCSYYAYVYVEFAFARWHWPIITITILIINKLNYLKSYHPILLYNSCIPITIYRIRHVQFHKNFQNT